MPTRNARKVEPDIAQFLPQVTVRAKPHGNGRRERRHPPAHETARDRFIRIGSQRMKNVLRDLRLLGNLSSANYEVTPRDVKVMRQAIATQFDQSFSRFAESETKNLEDTFAIT